MPLTREQVKKTHELTAAMSVDRHHIRDMCSELLRAWDERDAALADNAKLLSQSEATLKVIEALNLASANLPLSSL